MVQKLKVFGTLIILLGGVTLLAQEMAIDWLTHNEGAFYEIGQRVTKDKQGNVYTIGWFYGTMDFDPSLSAYYMSSFGDADGYLMKQDSNGNFLWVKQFGGMGLDRCQAITTDSLGDIYLTGFFSGIADFDPSAATYNLSTTAQFDAFICRIDSLGNLVWAKSIASTNRSRGDGIALDQSGNICVAGWYRYSADFDMDTAVYNMTTNGNFDVFVSKYTAGGNLIWCKTIGGTSEDRAADIRVSSQGDIFTSGVFHNTVDFDPGLGSSLYTSFGGYDAFVSVLDSNGNYLNSYQFGGANEDYGGPIDLDNNNNVYFLGVFKDSIDIDSIRHYSSGDYDIFFVKIDSSKNLVWSKSFGGAGNDNVYSVSANQENELCITGHFEDTVSFDSIQIASLGGKDGYIAKLDSDGDFGWVSQISSGSLVRGQSVYFDREYVYTIGVYNGNTHFNPQGNDISLTAIGINNRYLLKLRPYEDLGYQSKVGQS